MPKVTDEHRAGRRGQILAGARRAFAAHGYYGATVPQLEAAIGLSRGAIFSYYPSKLDLFVALATADRHRAGELWLEGGFDAVVRQVDRDPDWTAVYLETGRILRTDSALRARWEALAGDVEERIAARYAALQSSGAIRADMPVAAVMGFLGVVLDGLALQKGAGYPIDVEGTLALVRAALTPPAP